MAKERVFITVIAYPTFSTKHGNSICAAGFREDGSWIRVYPLPYRLLESDPPLQKNQWIELELKKSSTDRRIESYQPRNLDDIDYQENTVSWPNEFRTDRELSLLRKNDVHYNLKRLIDAAKTSRTSLGIFKPTRVLGVSAKNVTNWPPHKISAARSQLAQRSLLPVNANDSPYPVRQLPYKFSYKFLDRRGRTSELMIEDWELGQYFWRCYEKSTESGAQRQVKRRYEALINTKGLHYFVGTTYKHHDIAENPFVIIGVFNLPSSPTN